MSDIDTFMVYELDNSGEKLLLDIKEDDLQNNLHPEQVLVIVKEDLRRIFIWKGAKSPVRKRFISSRIAQTLQEELMKDARYHRCKIVSVDAGDEPKEFLRAFQLESMKVEDRLEDMRYIRNIEREGMVQQGSVVETKQSSAKSQIEEEYFSPALQDIGKKVVVSSFSASAPKSRPRSQPMAKTSTARRPSGLSDEKKEKIKEKILKTEIPSEYKRINLILGNTLFAAVSKTAKIFGKDVEETNWEPVKKVPEEMVELNNHVLRVYFNKKEGVVEAVEVLEITGITNPKNSVKKTQTTKPASKKKTHTTKPASKKKTQTTKPASKKKTQTIKPKSLDNESKPRATGRRQLPKIPSKGKKK